MRGMWKEGEEEENVEGSRDVRLVRSRSICLRKKRKKTVTLAHNRMLRQDECCGHTVLTSVDESGGAR